MRAISAEAANDRFDELLMNAQEAPVTIEENGNAVAVVYSYEDHHYIEEAKVAWLKAAIAEGDADFAAGRCAELTDEFVAQIKADGRSPLDRDD